MSHMVIYRGADGRPGYHQTEQLDDAVRFVEGLRNDEGVEHAIRSGASHRAQVVTLMCLPAW